MESPPKIVVLDDTQKSEDLIRTALFWTEILHAEIKVVRVIDETVLRDTTRTMGVFGPVAKKVRKEFIHEGTEAIHRILTKLNVPSSTEIQVISGHPTESIKEILDRSPVDLLILSPRLKGPLGMIAPELTGYARGNCLVLTRGKQWDKPHKILLATDGSGRNRHALHAATDLTRNFDGFLRIISVVTSNEELQIHGPAFLEKMYRQASRTVDGIVNHVKRQGLNAEGIVREGSVPDAIVADSREWLPELIVVGSFSRTGLNRLFMGSVAGTIITQVAAPVLVVKKPLQT